MACQWITCGLLCVPAGASTCQLSLHVVEKRGGDKVLSEASVKVCLKQVGGTSGWPVVGRAWPGRCTHLHGRLIHAAVLK
jgi:hypothetical protein